MPAVSMLECDLAVLVVIDVQEKMLSAISSSPPDRIIDRIGRLIRTAKILGVPMIWTEQYPKGLGATDGRLEAMLKPTGDVIVKSTCSSWRDEGFKRALEKTGREHVILTGLEAHVCIQQTALDLHRVDYIPFVAADAVGSRGAIDCEMAVARIRAAGVTVSTTESLIFELVERCDHPKFKDVLEQVK